MKPDRADLVRETRRRLLNVMAAHDVPAVLTSDPINILYATGARNMTVFSLPFL